MRPCSRPRVAADDRCAAHSAHCAAGSAMRCGAVQAARQYHQEMLKGLAASGATPDADAPSAHRTSAAAQDSDLPLPCITVGLDRHA